MRAVIFFNVFIGLIFLGIIVFQILLRQTMKKSLYYYRNVSYIAGIIFGTVLMLSLYNYLIECLLKTKNMRIYYIFREFISFPAKFATFALPIFIVICSLIIISNMELIRHEGLRLKNVLGVFLGLIFVGGTILNAYAEKIIETYILVDGSDMDKPIVWIIHTYSQLFILLVICYFEVYFIATVIMAYISTRQKPLYNKDFIIILGCSIDKKGGLLPLLKARTNRAIKYAWDQEIASGRAVKYVPSGGQGPGEVMSEGSAMELYLLSHGAEKDEVFAEKKSASTYENFKYSWDIIKKIDPDGKICFATTNYHMFRSGLIAKRMGIKEIEGVSSKTKWYFWPNGFVREFIAILAIEKKLHIISLIVLLLICLILAAISYFVFNMYWL